MLCVDEFSYHLLLLGFTQREAFDFNKGVSVMGYYLLRKLRSYKFVNDTGRARWGEDALSTVYSQTLYCLTSFAPLHQHPLVPTNQHVSEISVLASET